MYSRTIIIAPNPLHQFFRVLLFELLIAPVPVGVLLTGIAAILPVVATGRRSCDGSWRFHVESFTAQSTLAILQFSAAPLIRCCIFTTYHNDAVT